MDVNERSTRRQHTPENGPRDRVRLATVGLLGLLIGLFIGWVVWPVQWTDARLNELEPALRAQYISAVADAYVASGGQEPATALARLQDFDDPNQAVADAVRYYAQSSDPNRNVREVNLRVLASALGVQVEAPGTGPGATGVATSPPLPAVEEPRIGWINWLLVLLTALILTGGGLWIAWQIFVRREITADEGNGGAGAPIPTASPSVWEADLVDTSGSVGTTSPTSPPVFTDQGRDQEFPGAERIPSGEPFPHAADAGDMAGDERHGPRDEADLAHEPEFPARAFQRADTFPVGGDDTLWERPQPPAPSTTGVILETDFDEDAPADMGPGDDLWEEVAPTRPAPSPPRTGVRSEEAILRLDPRPHGPRKDASPAAVEAPIAEENIQEKAIREDGLAEEAAEEDVEEEDVEEDGGPEPSPETEADGQDRTPNQDSGLLQAVQEVFSSIWRGDSTPDPGRDVVATFTATYQYGIQAYDESFTIAEAGPEKEPLGACGMGSNEKLDRAAASTDQVRLLDVWLYDRSDIRSYSQILVAPGFDTAGLADKAKSAGTVTGEPLVIQPGLSFTIPAQRLLLRCTVENVEFLDDGGDSQPFRLVVVKMAVSRSRARSSRPYTRASGS